MRNALKSLITKTRGVFKSLALTLGLLVLLPTLSLAQINPYKVFVVPNSITSYSSNVTAVDTAPIMLVKYVGSTVQASTFAVTTFDYIFTIGGAADTTITGCGGTAGTLDTNNAACNTMTELVNRINASANWVAIPIGCLGADSVDTGGDCSAADVTATTGNIETGVAVYHDTSDALNTTTSFLPGNIVDIRGWMQANKPSPAGPFTGLVSTLVYYVQNFVGSAAVGNVYAVSDKWTGNGKTYSQTSRVLFSFTGAATGVDKALDFSNSPVFGNPGERIIVRGVAGTTMTSPRTSLFGFTTTR